MLEVANLEVVYNEVILVLRGLSIEVRDGQIVALLGANGAGKTTATRAITGLLDVHEGKITKGAVSLSGVQIDDKDPAEIVRSGITQVMEGRRVFAELTVDENLVTGSITSKDRTAIADAHERVMTLFPVLAERRSSIAGYLSGGEQQMLAIGRALMSSPNLLILDEPSLGLAPKLVAQIRDIIVEINQSGTSVLLIEQNANMALQVAHYGYVLEVGRIVMEGVSASLRGNKDIREFYLGIQEEGVRGTRRWKRKKVWR